MIYSFKTKVDQQTWMLDVELGKWARASSIIAAPSIKAAESNIAQFVPQEEGPLTSLGGGRYVLEGRQPLDVEGKPQLCLVMILTVLSAENEGTCATFIQSNVELEEPQHQIIKNFAIQCLPPIPTPNPKRGASLEIPEPKQNARAVAR